MKRKIKIKLRLYTTQKNEKKVTAHDISQDLFLPPQIFVLSTEILFSFHILHCISFIQQNNIVMSQSLKLESY